MSANVYPLHNDDDDDAPEPIPSIADIVPESELSQQAQLIIAYAARRGGRLPKGLTKASIKDNFDNVFEMIGGVPRLAIWADQNPSLFFAHYAKLLPVQARVDLTTPIPNTADPKAMTTQAIRAILLQAVENLPQQDQAPTAPDQDVD